jgi:molybdopterin-guanine dinucleotide biosynthesis adapter protein
MHAPPVFGVIGWKNSGKTTLVEALVRDMVRRGLRVSTIKHAHHAFDIDNEGKDSHRHRQAGATQVIVSSRTRWAMLTENGAAAEPTLDELVSRLAPCDLVLVEGYKSGTHPRIEVIRELGPDGRIADRDASIIAVATPDPELAGSHQCLPLNDPSRIVDFMLRQVERRRNPG